LEKIAGLPELPTKRVSVHLGRVRRCVAVGMIERELNHSEQVRAVRLVVSFEDGEMLVYERECVTRIDPV
jgi:hypothetical protein